MTLEEYLKKNFSERDDQTPVIDHIIRAHVSPLGVVSFYIHPYGFNGDTIDFTVVGNELTPK